MAWVAVDKDGDECISSIKPEKIMGRVAIRIDKQPFRELISIPKGSIKKLIGRELTWEDNPVKLEESNE